jgi:predicted nuclease with TOPRIM domain
MGNRIIIYKQKLEDNLKESYKHLERLESAFDELSNSFEFPLDKNSFEKITSSRQLLAYSDQIIYRFSKLQDCMGSKLFKSLLLFQGENVNKPFLDILNQLEKINVIDVDEWFEIRDLRNEIAHDYEDNELESITILNTIYKLRDELKNILNTINKLKEESI